MSSSTRLSRRLSTASSFGPSTLWTERNCIITQIQSSITQLCESSSAKRYASGFEDSRTDRRNWERLVWWRLSGSSSPRGGRNPLLDKQELGQFQSVSRSPWKMVITTLADYDTQTLSERCLHNFEAVEVCHPGFMILVRFPLFIYLSYYISHK